MSVINMPQYILEFNKENNLKKLIDNRENNDIVFLVENNDIIENITLLHIYKNIKTKNIKINFLNELDFLNNFLEEPEKSFIKEDNFYIINNLFLNNDKKPFWKKPDNYLSQITGIANFRLSPFYFLDNIYSNEKTDNIGICLNSFLNIDVNYILRKIKNEIKSCSLNYEEYYFKNSLDIFPNQPKPFTTNIIENQFKSPLDTFKDLLIDLSKLKYFIGNMNELFLLSYLVLGKENCILLKTDNYPEEYYHFFDNYIDINIPWKDLQLMKMLVNLFEKDVN